MACSSTWFLIVTLLAWGLVAALAALAAPHASAAEERGELPARAPRRELRRFVVVARASRGPGLRLSALASERAATGNFAPPT